MPRRSKVVEKANKKSINEWADSYEVPSIGDLFDAIKSKVASAVVKDLGEFIASNGSDELLMLLDETPGVLRFSFGGEQSGLTPHVIELEVSIQEIAKEVTGHLNYPQDREQLQQWRKAFAEALAIVDKAVEKG